MVATLLLEMRAIAKAFPGVRALRGIDLQLNAGEVLAVVGENGAGKSTLLKILGGAQFPDAGDIWINGRLAVLPTPQAAQQAGIAVIYQELNLIPTLSVRENIFLGRESTACGWLRHRDERRRAAQVLDELGVTIDPDTPTRDLSIASQQAVEIAKALLLNARILVMDEPTAALAPAEAERLMVLIETLKFRGVGIIYASHRLDEVFRLADRIIVLRDGEHVHTDATSNFSRRRLIELMVGHTLEDGFPPRPATFGPVRFVATRLNRQGSVRDVSFEVRAGEILAIVGLASSGRTETARLLFGADRRDSGDIVLDGKPCDVRSPRSAIRAGIALLPEDRKQQGLILSQSSLANFGLPNLQKYSAGSFICARAERTAFAQQARRVCLDEKRGPVAARHLSGGNQQKLVIAKWLEANCEVLIFDEPTRGIDVGAKYEIYLLMREMAAQGKCVIMISSDLPEILGLADRILVMKSGSPAGEVVVGPETREADVLHLAVD